MNSPRDECGGRSASVCRWQKCGARIRYYRRLHLGARPIRSWSLGLVPEALRACSSPTGATRARVRAHWRHERPRNAWELEGHSRVTFEVKPMYADDWSLTCREPPCFRCPSSSVKSPR